MLSALPAAEPAEVDASAESLGLSETLVGGCGAEAVAKAGDRSFDLVVVDAADGAGAPPAALSTPAFFADVGRVLTEPAVLAVNVVARDAETLARVRDAAACVGGARFECELPAPLVAEGSPDFARLLFAVRGDTSPSLAGHPLLLAHIDESELWMEGFRGLV